MVTSDTVTRIERSATAVPPDPVLRLSVEQYHTMVLTGILTADDPVELLEGWLILKMPKTPLHSATTRLIRRALEQAVPDGWMVDSQEPITTVDSEPEPDVLIMRGDAKRYIDKHPGPNDLALVVEVSDTTLRRDRELKKRIYANAGIAVYWIANLVERQVEAYAKPYATTAEADFDYEEHSIYGISDKVPLFLESKLITHINVNAIFPDQ